MMHLASPGSLFWGWREVRWASRGCRQEVWRSSRGVDSEVGGEVGAAGRRFRWGFHRIPSCWRARAVGTGSRRGSTDVSPVTPLRSDTANTRSLKAFTRRPHFV